MSAVPLAFEIVGLFVVTLCLLYKYSDFRSQNKIALGAVFIAWYFSFMIIFILPMDISLTTYHQCQRDHENRTDNQTLKFCKEPFSLLGPKVLPVLWRIIYWSSQALTWLILPFMQAFSQSGEFTLSGKIRGALIANAIYYGTYMAIFSVLLIYVAINYHIDGQKLKVIGITASNTWGLFLLVLLLGYGLVGVPRSLWYKSITSLHLRQIYFKLAKLHGEKCDAEETLEDILNEVRTVAEKVKYNNSLRGCVDMIVKKCPESFKSTIRRNLEDYNEYDDDSSSSSANRDLPTEKSLVKLHTKLIKALGVKNRTANQWVELIDEAFEVEDILTNETNSNRTFFRSAPYEMNALEQQICNPTLEWLYYCIVKKYSLKLFSIILAVVTIMVIWSEMTFFSKRPPLSLFAIFLNYSRTTYNYLIIEFVCCLTIAYLCFCAYYTIFKMKIFNYFYLTPNHQTNENSLILSGTLFCRLTSPLCYNFLGLVHLDSHITKNTQIVETEFTRIMGHMDVISFISDGFNIYFPILIFVFCVANFFELGGHLLHFLGFEQFLTDNELTHDLVEDGKNLVKREKRRLERNDPEVQLRHRDVSNRLMNNYSSLSLNSSTQNSSQAPSMRSTAGPEVPSTSEKVASALSSVKSAISSSLPAFLVKKSNSQKFKFTPSRVKEYRDIPPYTDEPASETAEFADAVATSSRGSRYLGDDQPQFGTPRDELFGNKSSAGSNKSPRNIFDDI